MSRPERQLTPDKSPSDRFGYELRNWRKAAGLSLARLGGLVHVSGDYLHKIETVQRSPKLDLVERCDRILGAEGALLQAWSEIPDQGSSVRDSGHNDFKSSGIAAIIPPLISPVSLVSLVSLDSRYPLSTMAISAERTLNSSDPQVIAFVSDTLQYYAKTAAMLGGQDLIDLVERHIRFIYSGLDGAHGIYRIQILCICARYAEFLGWLYQDLGKPIQALFWTDRALEWSQEAEDSQFQSYVLMRKSDHAEQYGTPDRVVAIARSALEVGSISPRSKALAIQQEARGYSQHGDQALFERKLDEARELISEAWGSGDAPWGEYCDLTYVAMQEASGRIDLEQYGPAIEILERELPNVPSTDRVDSTVFRSRLARAYAEDGCPERAAETALATCGDVRATASMRAFTELFRVRQILESHKDILVVASFIDTFDLLAVDFRARVSEDR